MKKLCDIVKIEDNNPESITLSILPDSKLDLIKLGFDGNTEFIFLSKGANHVLKIHKANGNVASWHWGENGHTLISVGNERLQKLIVDCVTDDFDIAIEGSYSALLRDCSKTGKRSHLLKVFYWNDKSDGEVVTHKDGIFYKRFPSEDAAIAHFENLGYDVTIEDRAYAKTGCNVDTYFCAAFEE